MKRTIFLLIFIIITLVSCSSNYFSLSYNSSSSVFEESSISPTPSSLNSESISIEESSTLNSESSISSSSNYDENINYENFVFTLLDDGTYAVSEKDKNISGDIVLPEYYQGIPVTQIPDQGFKGCQKIKSFTFSKNVTTIGQYAFYGSHIEDTLYIPDNINKISEFSFSNFGGSEIIIGNGLTEIPDNALSTIYIKKLTLGENIKRIGFLFCSTSTIEGDIYIPKNVSFIGERAFVSSSNSGFVVDQENQFFKDIDGVLFTKDSKELLIYPKGRTDDEYYIPSGVETIGEYSFCQNNYVQRITLSNNIKEIKNNAFRNCKKIKNILLNEGLETIGKYAFFDDQCLEGLHLPSTLTDIEKFAFTSRFGAENFTMTVDDKNPSFSIYNDCLVSKDLKVGYLCFTKQESFTLHQELERIECNFFTGFVKLGIKYLQINDNLKYIDAFISRTSIEKVVFPRKEITFVGSYMRFFYEAINLKETNLPLIDCIKAQFFRMCINLTSLPIPISVKVIEKEAFLDCTLLKEINYEGTSDEWNKIEIADDFASYSDSKTMIVHCQDRDLTYHA